MDKVSANRPTNTKVTAGRQKKIDIVAEISEKAGRAKALVFTNYQGMTHKQLEELKKVLRDVNAELSVTKNTLLKLALENSKFKIQDDLVSPTAALFVYDDVIAPLKQIAKTLKLLGLPTIKFGILDNQALTGEQVLRIASLPSREILLTQVVGGLKSPIFGFHRALLWNIQKLVMTFEQIKNQKENIKNT